MLLQVVTACYIALRALLTFGLLHKRTSSDVRPQVSVVIAARNEAATLPTLLSGLLNQTYPHYEVIIVDDRSDDDTPELLRQCQRRDRRLKVIRVTEVPEGRTPKMHALAQGIALAHGELLLLTDADCSLPRTWIEGMVGSFKPDVGAVLGYVGLQAANGTMLEQVQALDYFAMMATLAGATNLGFPLGATGANLAYRCSTYEQTGGFEALPLGAVADDMLLIQQVLDKTNWRVVFCDDPRTFVSTAAEPSLKQLLNQRVRWMAGGQEVLRNNRALLGTSMLIGMLNGMLLSFPVLLHRRNLRRALVQAVVGRIAADALHLSVAAARFRRWDVLRYLPLWLLLQLPYTIAVPLYSLSRKWSWK